MRPSRLLAVVCTALALLLSAQPAWAYIDPKAGGMLFQLLAPMFAAVVGGWLFLRRWIAAQCRRWWQRLTGRPPE